MASEVLMPRQGNTVESCIILSWKKAEGEHVEQGEVLCEVETDKATFEVEAPAAGTVLKVLHPEGADVPVLELIAVIGKADEDISAIMAKQKNGAGQNGGPPKTEKPAGEAPAPASRTSTNEPPSAAASKPAVAPGTATNGAASPRARNLAEAKGLSLDGVAGSGPGGRVIERDVQAVLGSAPELTPAAIATLKASGKERPTQGSGLGGRVTASDVAAAGTAAAARAAGSETVPAGGIGPSRELPVQGIRKRVAERMLGSLQNTAQVSLFMPADARELRAYRSRLKSAGADSELAGINLNDMVLYAVSRTLVVYPELNAHFLGDKIVQFDRVHLGFAVDTPRGLMVPVIKNADQLSLKDISIEAKRLAAACMNGKASSNDLSGGTFTVSNLGALGIEYFTPVLNPPQVGIVGVGSVSLKPIEVDGTPEFIPHLSLSLTVDHQAVDGAPAARFIRSLVANVAAFDLLLAE